MNLSKNFTIEELTRSDTARKLKIDNTPTPDAVQALITLCGRCLQPIRDKWCAPITVNSGYRSEALNTAIKGAKNSQHMKGEAADITVGTPEKNKQLFDMILRSGFAFDQLIDEQNYRWLHISYKLTGNRKQILHLK